MREPDFFIAGGPKCGTTAMFNYLKTHPRVFVPWSKEPHFFAEDLPGRQEVRRYEDYLELFAPSGKQHLAVGEGSVLYLYSEIALQRILERRPAAKIIVMLRNPVETVPAIHDEWVWSLNEDVEDLQEAWRLQEARARGRHLPRFCMEPKMLQYRRVASQGMQLERLLRVVPPEQRLVILYDDFARNTPEVYRQVLSFLDLPEDGRTEFPRINRRKQLRWPWLQRLICHRRLPEPVRLAGRRVGLHKIHRWIWRQNKMLSQKAPPAADFIAELRQEMRSQIELTESLMGRDLSHWLGTSNCAPQEATHAWS